MIFRKDLNLSETKARELVETIDEVVKSNQEGELKEVQQRSL
jgi:soluble cytochrome b562